MASRLPPFSSSKSGAFTAHHSTLQASDTDDADDGHDDGAAAQLPGVRHGRSCSSPAPRRLGESGSGSVGAFFAVLAAVLVLTVLSCVFGWVCASKAEGPTSPTTAPGWRTGGGAPRRPPVVPAAEAKHPVAPPLPLPLPEP
ncbi:hypothetical protein BS78_10G149400 [Paspalum vaginatum]|nr:hypothetical protein BS78_10G149400 [Paspalum vaginatum]